MSINLKLKRTAIQKALLHSGGNPNSVPISRQTQGAFMSPGKGVIASIEGSYFSNTVMLILNNAFNFQSSTQQPYSHNTCFLVMLANRSLGHVLF